MPTLDDLLKNLHHELPKLIQMARAKPDIAHGFFFKKDCGQEKEEESNIRKVKKYWKGDQPKSMQSEDREELIVYIPGLWETLAHAHYLAGLLKYARNGHLSLKDSTHGEWLDTQCSLWKSSESLKGCVHFAKAWHATGHTHVSAVTSSIITKTSKQYMASTNLLRDLSPLSSMMNSLIWNINPDHYNAMAALRSKLALKDAGFEALCSIDPSLHEGIAVIYNRRSGCHTDRHDHPNAWALMNVLGAFFGGSMKFEDLGLEVRFRPGDFMAIRGRKLKHEVNDWNGDIRVVVIYFTHESLWKQMDMDLP